MNPSILTDPHVAAILPYVLAILTFLVAAIIGIVIMTLRVYRWFKNTAHAAATLSTTTVKAMLETLAKEFRAHVNDERERFGLLEALRNDVSDVRERMIRVEERLEQVVEKVEGMEKERQWRHNHDARGKTGSNS